MTTQEDVIRVYRMHTAAHYATASDRLSFAIKTKYWWNGTHPDLIDDELGEVIDGQFFGPMWMREWVYKITDALDSMGSRKRRRWALNWATEGERPPNRWLRPVSPPDEPNLGLWLEMFSEGM